MLTVCGEHRRSQDFLWVHFLLDQKSDNLCLGITLSYMVIHCHQLRFYLICSGAPHQIQPHFASFQEICLEKIVRRPGGVHLHSLHPPGCVYGGDDRIVFVDDIDIST